MKSLADFTKKSKVAEANITRDKFYKNEVYKKGEWVLTEQGQVGKIHRRGPNYVLCLTAENTKFRSWITDIKEVFEIGTDAYREYVMSITPGQKVQKPKNTVKVPEVIPSKHPTNKMDKHESKTLAQIAAESMLNPKFKSMKETWRYDYSAKIGNTDIKGLGAKGVGGGDAPGMKLAEPAGTEGKPEVKKVKHSCATKVEHSEWGKGNTLKEMHTLDEQGNITHYDVMFEHGLEQDVPVPSLNILVSEMHEHVINDEKNEVIEGKKAKKDYDGDGKIESGKDEYFGSKDKAIKKAMKKESMKEGYGSKKKKKKSYGESTNKLGLKSWQSMFEGSYGEIDRPVEKESDTPEVKADVCFDAGAAIPTTIKGTGDPRELPTAINLMKNKYRAQGIMASKEPEGKLVEGMATPESGTGKYYNEKKPTAMQLAKRKKMEKVKSLTNKGKHKEASALYKEGIDVIKDILTK